MVRRGTSKGNGHRARCALVTAIIALVGFQSQALAMNIYVSNGFPNNQIFEYTPAGVLVDTINVPYGGGGAWPSAEHARDIIPTDDGMIAVYGGTFDPYMSLYDTTGATWSHTTHSGWSTINNVSYGGIASSGDFVYVTDMATAGAADVPSGIVRFDRSGPSSARFADGNDYIDLTLGLDGLLYALQSDQVTVDVYDPATMAFQQTVTLDNANRGIAVAADGLIYAASWDGNLYQFDASGMQLNSVMSGTNNLTDIDIAADGRIIAGGRFGDVLQTDTSLASVGGFTVGDQPLFVSFTEVQGASDDASVPEPVTAALGVMALAAVGATTRRRRA